MTFKVVTEGKEGDHKERGAPKKNKLKHKNHPEHRMFRKLGDLLCSKNTGYIVGKCWGGDGTKDDRHQ